MRPRFLSQAMSSIQSRSTNVGQGMTLIELITTIAVFTVVFTALTTLIQSFYKSNAYLLEQTAALSSARRGVNDAVLAIRGASYGDDGSYPVTRAATSSIIVYSDYDLDDSVERIRYQLINGVLYRATANSSGSPLAYTTEATTTVATEVRNTNATPLFTYYDVNGNQLSTTSTNIAQIAAVQVQLYVDLNPNRAPNVFTLTERVTLRNLNK
jgi:prepilin-type N-terminal cleavage/methylation domain-containing protein